MLTISLPEDNPGITNKSVGLANLDIGTIGSKVLVEIFGISQVKPPLLVISTIFLFSSIEPATPDTLAIPFVLTTIALDNTLFPPNDDGILTLLPCLVISANLKLAPIGMLGKGIELLPTYSGLLLPAIVDLV